MKIIKTNRGFKVINFKDQYNIDCSLQESSLATEACIWLGSDDANPQYFVPGQGWQPLPLPNGEISFHTRIHLTQKQVAELLPHLQKFVETGEL